MKNRIDHRGKVIDISVNTISVEICKESACSACHAKSACMSLGGDSKVINVSGTADDYKIGEAVNVFLSTELGLSAVFISYIIPLLILVLLLLSLSMILKNELVVGIVSLGVLGFYYLLVYLCRNKLAKKFVFSIEKI